MGEQITREEFESLRSRVQLLERAESRVVGEVFDLPDVAAAAAADVVEPFETCPHHPLLPTNGRFCGADGCEFSKR